MILSSKTVEWFFQKKKVYNHSIGKASVKGRSTVISWWPSKRHTQHHNATSISAWELVVVQVQHTQHNSLFLGGKWLETNGFSPKHVYLHWYNWTPEKPPFLVFWSHCPSQNPFRVMKSGISLFWRGKRPFVAHTGNSGLQTRTKNPLEIVAFTSKTWTSKRLCKPHFRPTILGPSSFWRQPRYFQYSQQHLQGCSIEVILRSIQLFGQETVTSLGLVMGFSHTSYQPEK